MAWTHQEITVGTSATKVAPTAGANVPATRVLFRTPVEATATFYLGGSGVTSATGVDLDADTLYDLVIGGGAHLVSSAETAINVAFGDDS